MRKVLRFASCIMSLIVFSFLLTAHAAEKKAPEAFSWDFGRAEEGAILKHDFILKNESNGNLTIKNISTSCGCTVSKIKKKRLMPQESTTLAVRFDTKGYSGPVKQYVYLITDNFGGSVGFSIDGGPRQTVDSPVIKLIIKARVIKGAK